MTLPGTLRGERQVALLAVLAALGEAPGSDLGEALAQHFRRLPSRYAADALDAESVLTHLELLGSLRKENVSTAVSVRAVNFAPLPAPEGPSGLAPPAEGAGGEAGALAAAVGSPRVAASPVRRLSVSSGSKRPPTFGSSLNLLALEEALPRAPRPGSPAGLLPEAAPAPEVHIHELAVAARNRPRLLSALSTLLGELGLNIIEAHAFCTDDGLALDVFVCDGWHSEEADDLHTALSERLAAMGEPPQEGLRGDTVVPAAELAIALAGDSSDWEIDTSRLHFIEKVAAGSFGDLFRGACASAGAAQPCSPRPTLRHVQRPGGGDQGVAAVAAQRPGPPGPRVYAGAGGCVQPRSPAQPLTSAAHTPPPQCCARCATGTSCSSSAPPQVRPSCAS